MALTPDQIAGFRAASEEIAQPVIDWLLRDITERVAGAGKMTSTAAYEIYRAEALGAAKKDLEDFLAKQLGLSNSEVENLFQEAAQMAQEDDFARVGAAISDAGRASLERLTRAAVGLAGEELRNITQTVGMVSPLTGKAEPLQQVYQECMDEAIKLVATGATSYSEAARQATRKLAGRGVVSIDYASGVSTELGAAVRRNLMGGMGLLVEQITQQDHDDLGCDGWEISAHANSAPDHEPIQGRQYSDTEYEALNSSLARRIGTLNCGHVAMPIILGVSLPQYTDEELASFREENARGVTWEGRCMTGYEATQYQNRIERNIRLQKRRVLMDEAAGDEEQLLTDSIKLTRLNQEYARYNKAMGFKSRAQRLETVGWNRSIANKATSAYRKEVEKYRAIRYNENGTIIVTDDWKSKGKVTIPRKYKPNAVLESKTEYRNGTVQIDRTIYDESGMMVLQIHSGPHNRPDKHLYGKHGEHVHRYSWNDEGELTDRTSDELSDLEREQHKDILGGEEAGS